MAFALVFNEDHALPQEIDKTCFIIQLPDLLFECGYPSAADVKDVKEAVPERFGFGIFTGLMLPFFGEGDCADFDFIPCKGHSAWVFRGKKVGTFRRRFTNDDLRMTIYDL